jgi:hypothetical protein
VYVAVPLDLTISLGDIITAGAFFVTGLIGVLTIRNSVNVLDTKLDLTDEQNERRFAEIDNQVRDFKTEMKRLSDVLIKLTEQDGRMNIYDERMLAQGKRIDSLSESVRDFIMHPSRSTQPARG